MTQLRGLLRAVCPVRHDWSGACLDERPPSSVTLVPPVPHRSGPRPASPPQSHPALQHPDSRLPTPHGCVFVSCGAPGRRSGPWRRPKPGPKLQKAWDKVNSFPSSLFDVDDHSDTDQHPKSHMLQNWKTLAGIPPRVNYIVCMHSIAHSSRTKETANSTCMCAQTAQIRYSKCARPLYQRLNLSANSTPFLPRK